MKLFPLEPPYTRSCGFHGIADQEPVLLGPLLARSRTSSRWHRPRSGVMYTKQNNRISYQYWCGTTLTGGARGGRPGGILGIDSMPDDGLPICGPCEGKAMGAGYAGVAAVIETGSLIFEPESQTRFRRPSTCPGYGLASMVRPTEIAGHKICICGACGLVVPIKTKGRGRGYSYDAWDAPAPHPPGPDLIDPCVFHAWDQLVFTDQGAECRCAALRRKADV